MQLLYCSNVEATMIAFIVRGVEGKWSDPSIGYVKTLVSFSQTCGFEIFLHQRLADGKNVKRSFYRFVPIRDCMHDSEIWKACAYFSFLKSCSIFHS